MLGMLEVAVLSSENRLLVEGCFVFLLLLSVIFFISFPNFLLGPASMIRKKMIPKQRVKWPAVGNTALPKIQNLRKLFYLRLSQKEPVIMLYK